MPKSWPISFKQNHENGHKEQRGADPGQKKTIADLKAEVGAHCAVPALMASQNKAKISHQEISSVSTAIVWRASTAGTLKGLKSCRR